MESTNFLLLMILVAVSGATFGDFAIMVGVVIVGSLVFGAYNRRANRKFDEAQEQKKGRIEPTMGVK